MVKDVNITKEFESIIPINQKEIEIKTESVEINNIPNTAELIENNKSNDIPKAFEKEIEVSIIDDNQHVKKATILFITLTAIISLVLILLKKNSNLTD